MSSHSCYKSSHKTSVKIKKEKQIKKKHQNRLTINEQNDIITENNNAKNLKGGDSVGGPEELEMKQQTIKLIGG